MVIVTLVSPSGEQLVNHISNGGCLTTKSGLLKSLEDYARTFNRRVPESKYAYYNFSRQLMSFIAHLIRNLFIQHLQFYFLPIYFDERGSIVVRAHASHAEGLRFEPDSMP